MSIINNNQARSLNRKIYKDVPMTITPFNEYLDELISEKATKSSEGWFLSLNNLTRKEIRKLEHLYKGKIKLEWAIDDRCGDLFENWRDNWRNDD